jgi:hypothetical protein
VSEVWFGEAGLLGFAVLSPTCRPDRRDCGWSRLCDGGVVTQRTQDGFDNNDYSQQ